MSSKNIFELKHQEHELWTYKSEFRTLFNRLKESVIRHPENVLFDILGPFGEAERKIDNLLIECIQRLEPLIKDAQNGGCKHAG